MVDTDNATGATAARRTRAHLCVTTRRRAAVTRGCALVASAILLAATPAVAGQRARATSAPEPGAKPPNVLLIVTDDQAWSTFNRRLMPTVHDELVDRGATFERAYVNTAFCCPSRAQIMTGLYEHHTGVDGNLVPLRHPTIIDALHERGYRTMMAGKYLNGVPCDPRPEFDEWICISNEAADYTLVNPTLNVNGTWRDFSGYQTDILAGFVGDFIAGTPADRPFFAMYTPTSPHLPANDARYADMPVESPRAAAFDEETRDPSKPQHLRRPALLAGEIAGIDETHRKMAHSVRALDDSVATILAALGDRAQDTIVFYISDNGYLYGEHRLLGKIAAYEEAVKVPFVVRYPRIVSETAPSSVPQLVSNVDIAPTIAELVGLPWSVDGHSLVPVLRDPATATRDAVLIEHCQGATFPCDGDVSRLANEFTQVPSYWGVVTERYKYVEYWGGDRELYDLVADPAEMRNVVADPSFDDVRASLASRLDELRGSPPVDTTIVAGPHGETSSRAHRFTYFSQFRRARFRCRLDRDGVAGEWRSCNGGSTVVGALGDGDYVFVVAAIDAHGVEDVTPATRPFSIRTSGPPVTITSAPPERSTSRHVEFEFATDVAGATFECRLGILGRERAWAPCTSPGASYGPLADGLWSFEARAIDASGATTLAPAQHVFRVDNTAPVMVFETMPRRSTSDTTADFRFEANETVAGEPSCRVDGVEQPCTDGVLSVTSLSEGPHTLSVEATDVLGNAGSTTYEWGVDTSPPSVAVRAKISRFHASQYAVLELSSNDPSARFNCTIDGVQLLVGCKSSVTLRKLSAGRHTFVARAYDDARNLSEPASVTFDVVPCAPGWCAATTPSPYPNGARLEAVAPASGGAWAVGSYVDATGVERPLIQRFHGMSSKRVASPSAYPGGARLNGVAATPDGGAWAVGSYVDANGVERTLTQRFDGGSWARVASPSSYAGGGRLDAVATELGGAWAVGSYVDANGVARPLILRHDGTSWARVASPSSYPGGARLNGVAATPDGGAWAVGSYVDGNGVERTLTQRFDGSSWARVASPSAYPGGARLNGVAATPDGGAWAVGSYVDGNGVERTLTQRFDGTSWAHVVSGSPYPAGARLKGVAPSEGGDVWAVGDYTDPHGAERMLVQRFDGRAWGAVTGTNIGPGVAAGVAPPWIVGRKTVDGPVRTAALRHSPVVVDSDFWPNTGEVGHGTTVTWTVAVGDDRTHDVEDASGLALFDSGAMTGGAAYSHTFVGAGTYAVRDVATAATSSISVPLVATPSLAGVAESFQISWGSARAPLGYVYDAQVRRPGRASFVNWRMGYGNAGTSFTPDAGPGEYAFRARMRSTLTGATSGWSRPTIVTATP